MQKEIKQEKERKKEQKPECPLAIDHFKKKRNRQVSVASESKRSVCSMKVYACMCVCERARQAGDFCWLPLSIEPAAE